MTGYDKGLFKLGISFLLVYLVFFAIGSIRDPITFELKKASPPLLKASQVIDTLPAVDSTDVSDTATTAADKPGSDTCKERVLLIGDSQLEGLKNPVFGYCKGNHYKLVATVIWYGSSTKQWGQTDTLDYFITKYKASAVIVAIGLNELFVNDFDNRKIYIDNIISKLKKHHVKYFWIGPAAWTKDKGIIDLMQQEVGKTFYASQNLVLERENDKRHPSRKAAQIWFDSAAVYVTKAGILNFRNILVVKPDPKETETVILSTVK